MSLKFLVSLFKKTAHRNVLSTENKIEINFKQAQIIFQRGTLEM